MKIKFLSMFLLAAALVFAIDTSDPPLSEAANSPTHAADTHSSAIVTLPNRQERRVACERPGPLDRRYLTLFLASP